MRLFLLACIGLAACAVMACQQNVYLEEITPPGEVPPPTSETSSHIEESPS